MKVLALYTGRKEQYSEFLAKTALMGAAEAGAEVQAINLLNLNLKPCMGCKFCHMFENGTNGDCVIKDDFPWLDEQIMESDAIVLCMPAYEKTIPGEFKIVMDRTGPSHDIAFREHMVKLRDEGVVKNGKPVDPRSFKRRPMFIIGHGGTDWGSLMLPVMELWAIPMGFEIVDMQYYPWNLRIYFEEEKLAAIKASGKLLAESIGKEQVPYVGPKGHCPVCHSDTMIFSEGTNVECAVCSMKGQLKIVDGEIVCEFSEEEKKMSQMADGGRMKHLNDINGFKDIIFSMDFMKLNAKKIEHMRWIETSRPPKA